MADNFRMNMGSLRSQTSITLHTHHATRLWMGRRVQADKPGQTIIGMPRFILLMEQIKTAAASDDPYADHWLIKMEERLDLARNAMRALTEQIDANLSKVPTGISIADNLNVQPLNMPLFINCQLGYIGVYLLTEFDVLARRILLANHAAMIGRRQMEHWLEQGAHEIRSVYGLAQLYRHAGVTRDDIAANNARARGAIDKFGELPQDVLEGSRRSNFAPILPQRDQQTSAPEHEATDDHSELDQSNEE